MSLPRIALGAVALAALASLSLSSCSSSADASDGKLTVVTSTNVYGNLAAAVGGDKVAVTAFIADAGQDPHSYEASAHDQLTLSKADVVVENGGGYDDFVQTMLDASGAHPTVLDAVKISGKTAPAGGELNEHVWYDFPTVGKVVDALAAAFAKADESDAATFRANAAKLQTQLAGLEQREATLKKSADGAGVAITEPVPLYLLQACGLVDKTPAQFSEAVEEGEGVPVSVLNQTLQLFSTHQVKALVYNAQTSGPETDQVIAAAKKAGVAVVPVTETMPSGDTYVSWMTRNLTALATALGQ